MTRLRPLKAALPILLCALTFTISGARTASAALISSAASGPWTTPSTWQGGVVPTAADDVIIAGGHTVTMGPGDTVTVNSIAVQGGVTGTSNALLQSNGTLTVTTSIALSGGTPQATGPGGSGTLEIGGALTAAQITINGGTGSALGNGGAAALMLTTSIATVNISSGLYISSGALSSNPGGIASVNLGSTGALDVRGPISNEGQILLGAGTLKSGGDYSGFGTFNPGTSTVRMDGTTYQYWATSSIGFHHLTIANSFSQPAGYPGAVQISATSTLSGTLSLEGGVLSIVGSLSPTSPTAIQRTSGHIHGYLNMPIPASQAVLFPLGTGEHYMPVTITSPTAGSLTARTYDYPAPEGGSASLNSTWELWSNDISTVSQIVFGYDAAQVRGTESAYVAGRLEDYVLWYRYSTAINTATHTATVTGSIAPNGGWTLAEPWAVTTATTFSVRVATAGGARVNTPFSVVLDAKDGSGNPAVFTDSMSVKVELGTTPTPTGLLKDSWGSPPPLYFYPYGDQSSASLDGVLYDTAEAISLIVTDTGASPRFTPLTLNLTVGPAASALLVNTTSPDAPGSLAHAIATANAGGCTTVPCPITFDIPEGMKSPDGTWKIVMPAMMAGSLGTMSTQSFSEMPSATAAVVIDATTQPGYSAAGRPVVELDAGDGYSGLEFFGGASTVRGLAIYNASTGIYLGGSGGHVVEGCYIGLTATGAVPMQYMYEGIYAESSNNFIGGPSPQQRNVISNAWDVGILLTGYVSGNSVRGNYVGTDPTGTTAVPNYTGIVVDSPYGNMIGGILAGEGNLISGNEDVGLLLVEPIYAAGYAQSDSIASDAEAAVVSTPNQVLGNTFGRTSTGGDLPNGFAAIGVWGGSGTYPTIGGPSAGQPNVVAHGANIGVAVGGGAVGVVVSGNTYSGAGMPIDLGGDGIPLTNDPTDVDQNTVECPVQGECVTGNNGQNTPEIVSSTQVGTTLETKVNVDSSGVPATQSIRVELYHGDAVGRTLIGTACFDTNFINNLTIFTPNAPTAAGSQVQATATSFTIAGCQPTDGMGSPTIGDGTSEFSAPATVVACNSPVVTITPPSATLCAGGSVALSSTVSGGTSVYTTYQWFNGATPITGATSPTYTATAAGSYTVSVTDSSGCIGSATATVAQNPALSVAIAPSGPTTFCAGGSVTLTANATGGSGTVASYAWYDGTTLISTATGPTLTVNTAGTFKVVITDSVGCSAQATQSVTVNAKPAATITAGGPTTFCEGGNVTLSAAGSGGTGSYTYQWLNGGSPITGATAATLLVSASGAYSVIASDANCQGLPSSPVTVTVNANPVVNITPSGPTTFCQGGNVTLTATAGSTYQWMKDGAPITGSAQTLLVSSPGAYSVTVTNGSNCTGTSSPVNVSVMPNPTPVITGPTSVCPGGNVTLTAGSGFASYLWSNGATTQSITVSPTATASYTVTVTAGGCSGTSNTHTVTIASAPSVAITGPASVCSDTPFTLDAGAGFDTYLWSNSATTRTITVSQSQATTYTVQVTAGGCSASASKVVALSPTPDATISTSSSVDSQSSRNGASVAAQSGASYVWSVTNGTIDSGQGTNSILFSVGTSGEVSLTVTVTIGDCSATQTATLTIANVIADLSLRMTAPAEVRAGDAFTYSLDVRNDGPATAADAVVTAMIPTGVTVEGSTGIWPCTTAGSAVTCRAGVVPSGTSGTIAIAVRAPATPGTLTASASISSSSSDNNVSNNAATASTEVVGAQATCPTVPPSLISPADGTTGVLSPVAFSWTAVEGATAYELWIVAGTPQQLGTTTSTSLTAEVPSGAMTWYVVARSANNCGSLTSATRRLTVAAANNCPTVAPQVTAPTAGSTTTSPVTFTWSSVPNATGYRLLVRVGTEASLQDLGTTTGALTLTVQVPPGAVEAFVEAIYSGCPPARSAGVSFTVAAPDPCADRQIATLTSPANEATVNSSLVRLEWAAAAGADGYRVWVAVDDATPQVIGATEGETFFQVALGRGKVVWWVEALYDGCASTESARRAFTIPPAVECGTALADPILPLEGALLPSSTVTFTWANVASAVEYELWLSLGEGTPTLFGETDGATTSLTASVPPGNMKWFVRARVDRCPPRDSGSASFSHQPPASCSTNQRPILVFPSDGERLTSPMNLRWSTPEGATRFEILVDRGNGPVVAATSTGGSAENVTLPTGRIKWFARAYYGENCSPLDSAEQSIQVLPQPAVCGELDAPVISAPGQISSGVSFRIHWTPIPGATSYNLQIASRADFGDAEVVSVSSAEYLLERENRTGGNTAVYVRARALDTRCNPGAIGPYGPTSAIFILPIGASESNTLASETTIVESSITLGAELAGQSFTATPNATWITVTPSSGVVAAGGTTLKVTANTTGLPLGTTIAGVTVTLVTPAAGNVASQGTTTVTTPISINLVTPVTPTAKSGPPPDALIIPAVAHADGINAKFQSDVRVTNSSAQLMKYLVTFIPTGQGIASGRQTSMSIEPGRTVALDDVLKSWFGTGSVSTTGTLEIRPQTQAFAATSSSAVKGLANLATFASSRTFNMASNGSFGQHIPAIPFANFVGKGVNAQSSVLSLQQIAQSSQYRTNLGLVEGSGNPASLLVNVFGKSGNKLTSFAVDLKGGEHTQLNSFLASHGITSLDDGRVEVSVTSGLGKVTAYASVLDNTTSDPLLVTPVALSESGDTKWVVPGVADLNNGFANWQTDLRIFNGENEPVETTVSFYSQNGGTPKTATFTIPAGEVRQLDRALTSLFSVSNDGGAIHLSTAKASRIVATARTYNLTGTGGTFGQFINAVTQSETAALGTRPLQLLQIEESDRFRSNIGLAETSGKPVKVSISVIPPDAKLTAFLEVDLAPNEFRQIGSLLKTVGMTNVHNARVTVRAVAGSGRVTAYASVVDLLTQDPTYIPAQ